MAEIDPEVLERVRTWCAEAGRQALAAEIRAAIAPLGWDELLAVKALLADPPPARPLGPHALADIARGAPPDVAAERERAGRYAREGAARDRPAADGAAPSPRQRRAAAARGSRTPQVVVVRRARDRAPEPPPPPPALPSIEELRRPEARAVLERLVRRHGGRRARIASDLAAAWRRPDGGPPGEEDVSALMEHHGLARAFERRERDELLHALRAAGGVRPRAAGALGLDAPGLDAALARLGAAGDAERIREERRRELRARATLSERVHLLLDDPARLDDLGLLPEIEAELRTHLPEHLRALAAASEPLFAGVARSLSLAAAQVSELAARFGLSLGPPVEPVAPAPGPRTESGGRRRTAAPGRARAAGPRDRAGERPRARPAEAPPRERRGEAPRRTARPGSPGAARRAPGSRPPPRGRPRPPGGRRGS